MDIGPLISPEAKLRAEKLVRSGVDQGAKLLVDGRGVKVNQHITHILTRFITHKPSICQLGRQLLPLLFRW